MTSFRINNSANLFSNNSNSSNKASAIKQKVHWIYQLFHGGDEGFFLSKLKTNSICKTFAHCQCHPGVIMSSMVTLQRPDRSTLCWSLLFKQHRPTKAVMNFSWPRRCQFSNHLPDQGQNIAAIAFAHPNDLNHYEIKWNLTRPPILKLNVSINRNYAQFSSTSYMFATYGQSSFCSVSILTPDFCLLFKNDLLIEWKVLRPWDVTWWLL